MAGLWGLVLETQAAVSALGLRCVTSPNDMNPPCVLVAAPGEVTPLNAAGTSLACTVTLEVIARGLTQKDLQWACDTVDLLMAQLPGQEANQVVYRMSDGKELPSYTITLKGST